MMLTRAGDRSVRHTTVLRLEFAARVWLRARLLPFLIGRKSLEDVIALCETRADPRFRGLALEFVLERCRKSVRHPVLMRHRRCLRHGALGYYFLKKCGYSPTLHLGVDHRTLKMPGIVAHCWVCLDNRPVISDSLEGMTTIYTWPTDRLADQIAS